jgi:hypothetical protein
MINAGAQAFTTLVVTDRKVREVSDPTRLRLDTADLADGSGWQVKSTESTDEFTRDGITIEVQYSSTDDIDSFVKRGPNHEYEVTDHKTMGKVSLLRLWLTGQAFTSSPRPAPKKSRTPDFTQHPGDWTREHLAEFPFTGSRRRASAPHRARPRAPPLVSSLGAGRPANNPRHGRRSSLPQRTEGI